MRPRSTRMRSLAVGLCGVLLPSLVSCAQETREIVVWKVGSPNSGDKPAATIPSELRALAARSGLTLRIKSFAAAGFASTFREAVRRNSTPDLLVFNNFGILMGLTTQLEQFEGIAPIPVDPADFIQIRETFDSLLAPARGWVYAYKKSLNYAAATKLALSPPECAPGDFWPDTEKELAIVVTDAATSYLEWNANRIRSMADPERLETTMPADRPEGRQIPMLWERATVAAVKLCGLRGNNQLAMAWTNVSAESRGEIGHTRIVVILRKTGADWKLLVASRDPVTNRDFVNNLRARPALFTSPSRDRNSPAPALLLSPAPMAHPVAPSGERFGIFTWQKSPSRDVETEIAEFAYDNDARMFLVDPIGHVPVQRMSEGALWHTNSLWRWRVWSLSAAGDIAFSESRPLPH